MSTSLSRLRTALFSTSSPLFFPVQSRPAPLYGVGNCLALPSAPFHWGGGWLINASGLGNISGADVALSRSRKFFSHTQGMPDACHALVSADTWCSSSGDAWKLFPRLSFCRSFKRKWPIGQRTESAALAEPNLVGWTAGIVPRQSLPPWDSWPPVAKLVGWSLCSLCSCLPSLPAPARVVCQKPMAASTKAGGLVFWFMPSFTAHWGMGRWFLKFMAASSKTGVLVISVRFHRLPGCR